MAALGDAATAQSAVRVHVAAAGIVLVLVLVLVRVLAPEFYDEHVATASQQLGDAMVLVTCPQARARIRERTQRRSRTRAMPARTNAEVLSFPFLFFPCREGGEGGVQPRVHGLAASGTVTRHGNAPGPGPGRGRGGLGRAHSGRAARPPGRRRAAVGCRRARGCGSARPRSPRVLNTRGGSVNKIQ